MLRLIIIIIIIIAVLSFFGISLQAVLTSPAATANFNYVWQLILQGWNIIVQFIQSVFATIGIHVT